MKFTFTKNTIYISLFCLLSLLVSCKSFKNADLKEDDSKSSFIPNPQKVEKQEVKTLEIGDNAPYFNLPNIDGEFYSLDNFKDSRILVVIFTCNHCPTAHAYEDRIIAFANDYKEKVFRL